MYQDLLIGSDKELRPKRAGMLPYVALAGGIASCFAGYAIFWLDRRIHTIAREFRDSLVRASASPRPRPPRLLGSSSNGLQRWAAGRPPVGEPAAQGVARLVPARREGDGPRPYGRTGGGGGSHQPCRAPPRGRGLRVIEPLGIGQRNGWRRRWRSLFHRCRATSTAMVVHFNRLADGSFLSPAIAAWMGQPRCLMTVRCWKRPWPSSSKRLARSIGFRGRWAASRLSHRASVTRAHTALDEAPIP